MLVDLYLSVEIFRVRYSLNGEAVVVQNIILLIRFGGKPINNGEIHELSLGMKCVKMFWKRILPI
jgi:hypothetical protein